MARFHGKVGFLIPHDDQETGVAQPEAVEKSLFGKVLEHTRRWDSGDQINDNLTVANQIAVTATDFAFKHASSIVYVHYMGGLWKVTSIKVKRPKIILTLGGVWNGQTPVPGETENPGAESLVPETPGE